MKDWWETPFDKTPRELGRTPCAAQVRARVLRLSKRGTQSLPASLRYDDDLRAGRWRDGTPWRDMTPLIGDVTAAVMKDSAP